jgi:hypothetical protein
MRWSPTHPRRHFRNCAATMVPCAVPGQPLRKTWVNRLACRTGKRRRLALWKGVELADMKRFSTERELSQLAAGGLRERAGGPRGCFVWGSAADWDNPRSGVRCTATGRRWPCAGIATGLVIGCIDRQKRNFQPHVTNHLPRFRQAVYRPPQNETSTCQAYMYASPSVWAQMFLTN